MRVTWVVAIGLVGLSTSAWGRTLMCNKEQTRCMIESTSLTIGDKVGIINDSDEMVASGTVSSIHGERRSLTIDERHGVIRKDHNIILLNSPIQKASAEGYRVYKEPASFIGGASIGLMRLGVGDGAPGVEVSGFAQWRKWHGIQLVGRGTFVKVDGDVTRYHQSSGLDTQNFSLNGFGLLGGAAYTLRERKPLSFRGEVGVGLMHVSAAVGGDAGLVDGEGFSTKVKNGVGLYGRGTIGAVWNRDLWHFSFDVGETLIHQAMGSMLILGAGYDL